MHAVHLAIDGSIVRMEGEADLSLSATATGWAVSPALLRAHPFATHPPGHSSVVEEVARSDAKDVEIRQVEDFKIKDGELRVGVVDLPTAHGGRREVTVGAWEGRTGSLSTSIVGSSIEKLVEVFDTLEFSESDRGLKIDSPVVPRPRTPEVAQFVPEVGMVSVRPAIPSELERVPRGRGKRVRRGELFRAREGSRALMLVTRSSVVDISPREEAETDRILEFAENLDAEWRPRGRGTR